MYPLADDENKENIPPEEWDVCDNPKVFHEPENPKSACANGICKECSKKTPEGNRIMHEATCYAKSRKIIFDVESKDV